jgi:hypothetical protein
LRRVLCATIEETREAAPWYNSVQLRGERVAFWLLSDTR